MGPERYKVCAPDLANRPVFGRYSKPTTTFQIYLRRLERLRRCRSLERSLKRPRRQRSIDISDVIPKRKEWRLHSKRGTQRPKIAADGNQAQNLETWVATWDNAPYIPESLISVCGFIGRRSGGPPAHKTRFHMSHQPITTRVPVRYPAIWIRII